MRQSNQNRQRPQSIKEKKLSPAVTARSGAAAVISQVLDEGAYTNIALNKFLREHSLPDQERRLLTELVYGTVKALGTLDWYLGQCLSRSLAKTDKKVLHVLRLSLFQLLYLERIPARAAVNEAVLLARRQSGEGAAKFVNGVLRSFLRRQEAGDFALPDAARDDAGYLALKYCHPRWLIKRWLGVHGREGTEKLLQFNNSAAPLCLRVNTLVTTREALLRRLQEARAEARASQWSGDGIVCGKMPALEKLFQELRGAFYIQDESSMLAAEMLEPRPGDRVLDLCSAPGGKATHLAQLMRNQGEIVACDIYEHKLRLISENAQRLGITIIRTELRDAAVFAPELQGWADRVLVDAPCSGLGVLRRRAEARWRKTRADLKTFPPLQLQILENAARCVKEGGRLLYSTCTIEQSENHYLIKEFLARHREWRCAGVRHPLTGELLEELQLLPQRDGIDGFYICALERRPEK